MECNPTNPISSNSVVEVGLLKPKCATFTGNSLNDWLKWLAEKQCEVDYSTFDLSCLTSAEICDQTEKKVIQTIIDTLCELNANRESIYTEEVQDLTMNAGWSATRTAKVYRRGKLVHLSGLVTGGNVGNSITTLPSGFKPATDQIFSTAHAFTPSGSRGVFVKVESDGDVILSFTGTPPVGTSPDVYLDGISFFIY